MKSRRTTPRWVERQIDEALLMISMQTAFLYAHRRARRVLPKVAVGAAVATGVSAAATVAGLGVVGVAGGAAAWYRHSKRSAAAAPQPAAPAWRPPAVGATPESNFGSNAGTAFAKATESESSPTR